TAPPTTAPTGPPTAAPTTTPAAPPPAAPTPVPTGCEPGSPVNGSRLRAASWFAFDMGSLLERKRHISASRPPRAKSAPGVSRSGGAFGRTEAAAAFAGSEQDFPGRAGRLSDSVRRRPPHPGDAGQGQGLESGNDRDLAPVDRQEVCEAVAGRRQEEARDRANGGIDRREQEPDEKPAPDGAPLGALRPGLFRPELHGRAAAVETPISSRRGRAASPANVSSRKSR